MSAGTWTHQEHPATQRAISTASDDPFDVLAGRAAALGVAVLIVIGFVSSYTTVRDLAVRVGDFPTWLAPIVPLSFDVGIIVLSLRILLAARQGRTARVLRLMVLVLSVVTVVVNGVASHTLAGHLLHAVPSAMFVVCFETVIASARTRALGYEAAPPDPRFRPVRWVLAPLSTWTRWRANVLADEPPAAKPETPATASTAPTEAPTRARESIADCENPPRTQRASPAAGLRPRGGESERLSVAGEIVAGDPGITASVLAARLGDHGFNVSIRTAQRIRELARLTSQSSPDDNTPVAPDGGLGRGQ